MGSNVTPFKNRPNGTYQQWQEAMLEMKEEQQSTGVTHDLANLLCGKQVGSEKALSATTVHQTWRGSRFAARERLKGGRENLKERFLNNEWELLMWDMGTGSSHLVFANGEFHG